MRKNELKLNEDNIKMTLDNDVLGRKSQLINLIKLLNALNENFTISVDGDWGVGKTFFVNQLLYLYDNCEKASTMFDNSQVECVKKFRNLYIPIYYNAWENDDHENVIESLIYNILDKYPKYKKNIETKKQDFEKIIKPILVNIIDKLSCGLLTAESFDNIKTFEDLSEKIVTTEEKKANLIELFEKITDDSTRLLLIIDELDRCKPDYAVKLLETIKHFYNYKNITILVVTNNRQLSESIKHFYGYGFDGYGYLNKMYDTVLSIEPPEIEKYLGYFLDFENNSNLSEEISFVLLKYLNFNLRECNSYIWMYNISIRYITMAGTFEPNKYLFQSNFLLPIGLALKVKNIDEYNRFISGKSENFIKELLEYIATTEDGERFLSWICNLLNIEPNEFYIEEVIKFYKKTINAPKSIYNNYPIQEALSLLGNVVIYEEDI